MSRLKWTPQECYYDYEAKWELSGYQTLTFILRRGRIFEPGTQYTIEVGGNSTAIRGLYCVSDENALAESLLHIQAYLENYVEELKDLLV